MMNGDDEIEEGIIDVEITMRMESCRSRRKESISILNFWLGFINIFCGPLLGFRSNRFSETSWPLGCLPLFNNKAETDYSKRGYSFRRLFFGF
ncbi:hypothetical protein LINGRAHAP2_LOCUS33642, partial [Linum grandiflorum]